MFYSTLNQLVMGLKLGSLELCRVQFVYCVRVFSEPMDSKLHAWCILTVCSIATVSHKVIKITNTCRTVTLQVYVLDHR